MESQFERNLNNLINENNYKWIFVGGKGGVGKTTTSSSISVLLAQKNQNVLIISTDPAHNLSDCFDQKFGNQPTMVKGFDNLYGMEIDPKIDPKSIHLPSFSGLETNDQATQTFLSEILSSVPGIDEAMSFAELINHIEEMKFEVIVFDTAPTGHTLRLLNFPNLLEKGLDKAVTLKAKFSSVLNNVSGLFGGQASIDETFEKLFGNLEKMKKAVEKVNAQMKDPTKTTFVAVCIPEFLSMFETERLVQELTNFNIDIHNIVVNQVLYPQDNCNMCRSRSKMQMKYLEQIIELYEDFHITVMPLQEQEVRGVELLKQFSQNLLVSRELPKLQQ